jgi:type II secretory pathway predicted ATPase ExeA
MGLEPGRSGAVNWAFYGLRAAPFTGAETAAYFPEPGQEAVLSELMTAVELRRGFALVLGEAGSGKTMLARALATRLPPETARAYVSDASVPLQTLLQQALAELGLAADERARSTVLRDFLHAQAKADRHTVLILDRAERLRPDEFERIRLLSTMDLLQLVFFGRPGVVTTLRAHAIRQLNQRLTVRRRLAPFESSQVGPYIRARLRAFGATSDEWFTDDAIGVIAARAKGNPAVINRLAEGALLVGYAANESRIGRETAARAIAYDRQLAPLRGIGRWMHGRRERPEPAGPTSLVVVARPRVRLHEMIRYLAGASTSVILDRRLAPSRAPEGIPERRLRRSAETAMRRFGFAVVRGPVERA